MAESPIASQRKAILERLKKLSRDLDKLYSEEAKGLKEAGLRIKNKYGPRVDKLRKLEEMLKIDLAELKTKCPHKNLTEKIEKVEDGFDICKGYTYKKVIRTYCADCDSPRLR